MKCRLCGSEDIITIHKGVRDNKNINVLRCNRCGLVFLSDMSQITDTFYQDGGMHTEEDTEEAFLKWRDNTYADDHRRAVMISEGETVRKCRLDV